MADQNPYQSYRTGSPYRQEDDQYGSNADQAYGRDQGAGRGGDPLAELARLIGQNDPYTEVERAASAMSGSHAPEPQARNDEPDWRKFAAAMPAYETVPPEVEAEFRAGGPAPRHVDPPMQMEPMHIEPILPGEPGMHLDAFARPTGEVPRARVEPEPPRFQAEQVPTERRYERESMFPVPDPIFPASDPSARHADTDYARPPQAAYATAATEGYYDEGARMAPRDDEMYDDPPRTRRRSGLVTAITLIGCAMIGTAGAYGYRTYYVAPSADRAPPVITAETTPTKVVATTTIDSQPNKFIQDRVRDQGERVVSREEQPVELRSQGTSASPRVVLPNPVGGGSSAFPPPPQTNSGNNNANTTATVSPRQNGSTSAVGDEPRRVRTVTIRPDGTDLSGRPVGGITGSGNSSPPPAARPAAPSREPVREAAPKTTSSSRNPMSLDPQTGSTPARERSSARYASASAVDTDDVRAGTGNFLVQLSSQKSEGEARASFRALQSKFPGQLGSRSPVIRRADLGDKGIYFRALVGPFGSSDEAGRFCTNLRAAGGQCIIQRN